MASLILFYSWACGSSTQLYSVLVVSLDVFFYPVIRLLEIKTLLSSRSVGNGGVRIVAKRFQDLGDLIIPMLLRVSTLRLSRHFYLEKVGQDVLEDAVYLRTLLTVSV